jgi:transcriptional regulator
MTFAERIRVDERFFVVKALREKGFEPNFIADILKISSQKVKEIIQKINEESSCPVLKKRYKIFKI